MNTPKYSYSLSACLFAALISSGTEAATITGLTPAPNGTPATVPSSITYDQGSVSTPGNFLPIWNKGTTSSYYPYDSKWTPDKLTFYYSTQSSGGYFNSSIDWGKTTYNHISYLGSRTATFGLLAQYTAGQEGALLDYTPSYLSLTSPQQKVQLLSGSEIMERRYNQTSSPPPQVSYVRAETDVTYSNVAGAVGGTIEVNGQVGGATSSATWLTYSPSFLWSGTYNLNGAGTPQDFPVFRAGGATHRFVIYKRPADYAAAANPVEGIVLDPALGKITINDLPVMTGTSTANVYALGEGTTASGASKTVVGRYNTAATGSDPNVLFAVGGGSAGAPADALIVNSWGVYATGGVNASGGLYSGGSLTVDENVWVFGTSTLNALNAIGTTTLNSSRAVAQGSNSAAIKTNTDYALPVAGTSSNALRVTDEGTIVIKPQGDISMGAFLSGPTP